MVGSTTRGTRGGMMIPKWLRELPFWDSISATFRVAFFVAAMGILLILAGCIKSDVGIVAAGLLAAFPFLTFLFLLWRTHVDDGYRQR
jgi:hypothetical protein